MAESTITVYVSSPGDVQDEREIVLDVVRRLRYDPFIARSVDLRVASWDNPAAPIPMLASEHPQHSINELLSRPAECDIVVAILWSRLGTPLPGGASPSGTAWEIEDALGPPSKADVLVYHKVTPATVPLGDPDWQAKADQYANLQSYLDVLRKRLTERGLGMVQDFDTLADFRAMVDAHLRHLVARRITPSSDAPKSTWDGSRSPYPGLQAFTIADADCFFGRDREVDALAAMVKENRLTTVIGPSGSGKSSLIGAGLMPRLGQAVAVGGLRWARDASMIAWWAETVRAAVAFVDQFEEVFAPSFEENRDSLIDSLVELADSDSAKIVLSLRADFLGAALQHEGLARHLRAAMFPLGPPDLSAVTEIISRPAAIAGLTFDRDLPELLLVHARQEPGRLPLLAFALNELYLRRDGDRLTMAAYHDIGGVEGAIGQLAERAFRRLPEEARADFGAVFRALVEVDEVGGPIRRRANRDSLAQYHDLVDALVSARLLVADAEHVEVAHEAIFRSWPRLAEWIDATHEDMLALSRMRRAAADWQRNERDRLYLWPQERIAPTLAAVERLASDVTAAESEFLTPEPVRLLDEIATPGVSHTRRREVSIRLAQLGDPRPGVGVLPDGRVDIVWCRVPGSDPLWIAKYPITVAQLDFLRRTHYATTTQQPTGLELRQPNLPATCTWREATAFCQWLIPSRVDFPTEPWGYVVRLPTKAEWERAAGDRATQYPWGDQWDEERANASTSGLGGPLAVGMYPLGDTQAGASDMIGSVWEWCDDGVGDKHALKGGSAREHPSKCRINESQLMRGDVARDDRGFRPCVGRRGDTRRLGTWSRWAR